LFFFLYSRRHLFDSYCGYGWPAYHPAVLNYIFIFKI
jgi:hypothetical protein